jgi:magnesium-transporting ATPase (P-type)
MIQTSGSNIFIGDIIKLTHNQTVPCDLLLLATSENLNGNQVCKVDSWFDDGKSLRQVKEAVSLTKSFSNLAENDKDATTFLARLNAKVEYWINQDSNCIEGTFKLKSDPRIETIGENMVVRKGSIIKTQFMWGLVLYNGNRCLDSYAKSSFTRIKVNSIQAKIRSFSLILIIANVALSCLNYLFYLRQLRHTTDRGLLLEEPTTYLTFVTLYFSVMPLTLNITANLVTSFGACLLQKRYAYFKNVEQGSQFTKRTTVFQTNTKDLSSLRLVSLSKTRPKSFSIINPEVVLDLGDIDDVFFDKTDTLTTTEYDVKTIANTNHLYLSDRGSFFPDPLDDNDSSDSDESLEKPKTIDDIRLKLDYSEYSMIKNKFLQKAKEFDIKTPRMPMTPFENGEDRLETEEPLLSSGKDTNARLGSTRSPSGIKSVPINISPPSDLHLPSAMLKPSSSPLSRYKKNVLGKTDLWRDRKTSKEVKKMLLMFSLCHKTKSENMK